MLVAARELRLLLGLLFLLFVTAETWRFVGRLSEPRLAVVAAVAVGAAVVLTVVGIRRTVPTTLGRDLTRKATLRVVAEVLGFGVGLTIGFVVLGLGTVDRELVAEWTGAPAAVAWSAGIGEPNLVITGPLLQVAIFLGSLGTLAFALEAVIDPETRHTLLRDLLRGSAG